MRHNFKLSALVSLAVALGGCTVHQDEAPGLTGPSSFGTALSVTASPDLVVLGQSFSAPGQSSVIQVRVLDQSGQPRANRPIRLDTLVNNVMEDCGTLQARNLTTDSNGLATTLFTAPGTPVADARVHRFRPRRCRHHSRDTSRDRCAIVEQQHCQRQDGVSDVPDPDWRPLGEFHHLRKSEAVASGGHFHRCRQRVARAYDRRATRGASATAPRRRAPASPTISPPPARIRRH